MKSMLGERSSRSFRYFVGDLGGFVHSDTRG